MEILSYIAVVTILCSYAILAKHPRLFDWANALGNIPLVYVAYTQEAYASMIIGFCFGLIAVYRLWEAYMFK
jgi:hypothetical protein